MWEIFAYQNSDSLFGIFNASAAMMGSNGYQNSIAIVAIIGFFAAFFAYAFQPQLLIGWKWLGTVVLVTGILVVPRVTVGIVDKTGGSPVQVVDNVPFGAAVLGSVTSRVGNTLTELFETAFQFLPGSAGLPAELAYRGHGLAFGDRLIRDTRTVVLQDPAARTDLINFVNNCTLYDLIDGTLSPAAFSASDNVWPLMGTPNPARFTPVTTAAGTYSNMTCPDAYRNLDGRMPTQIAAIQGRLAGRLNPTLPAAVAQAAIAGSN
jgi:conjugal transfer mating pair stabilization protein TraG